MKLLEIEIRNLKSITNASLTFPAGRADYQVSLLYGDNGAGKTTVLEAISLVGHISTMRRIHTSGGELVSKPSRFRQTKIEEHTNRPDQATALRSEDYEKYSESAFDDQCQSIRTAGLNGWWESASVSGDPFRRAMMRYHVFHENDDFTFFISFLQNRDLSITEALSRDQKGVGAKIHDGNMDNWFAVVYDSRYEVQVEKLIEHMQYMSPHSYFNELDEYRTDSRAAERSKAHSLVAYWNTDLNDFGRKNDLRGIRQEDPPRLRRSDDQPARPESALRRSRAPGVPGPIHGQARPTRAA
jgi:energy-coupling factor transporter ATP-binding protein EcfA2